MREAKITDLSAYRTKKSLVGDRKSGLQDTFGLRQPSSGYSAGEGTSHAPHSAAPESHFEKSDRDIAKRIERLKSSINRINELMNELRSIPDKDLNQSPLARPREP